MRLYSLNVTVTHCPTPHLGERSYLQLDVDFSDTQAREAVVSLLSSMSIEDGRNLLQNDFPELLTINK